nr:hypothetical protein [Gemmatimonadota bacterium]
MTLDSPDSYASRDPQPVLNALTAVSALVGLALGVRLAWAGHDPVLAIGGGVLLLPLAVRLAGRGL